MADTTRVVVLGTGHMGSAIARLVHRSPGLVLVGAHARRAERAGRDVGAAVGMGEPLGIAVEPDLARLLAATRPHVAVQATCSRLADAAPEIVTCVEHGVAVVSIAEELAFPAATDPAGAARLDRLAAARGVPVLGTGVNPGFVLDLLVLVLTGVCADVGSIRGIRVNDLSPYGPTVLASQGVGLTPEAFLAGVGQGELVGHVGFPQSIALIADTLGWTIDRVEETREPIVATRRRTTPDVTVEPGRVAGCRHVAVGYEGDRPRITLVHPQQIDPGAEGITTGDTIEIDGSPPIRLAGEPEIPGGEATVALAVNAIDRLLTAAPGLRTMADLPVVACFAERRHPTTTVAAGTWVEVRRVVAEPGERAPQVPEETQQVPLELIVKGTLVTDARPGGPAEVRTRAGRRVTGTLGRIDPAYTHGFGPPVPELLPIGDELRTLLATGPEEER